MAEQTAVEWLIDQMFKQGYFDGNKPLSITNLDHLQHQAKEMEKQQIIDAHRSAYGKDGKTPNMIALGKIFDKQAEQYYNETYGSKGSADRVLDVRKMVDNWDNVFDKIESEYDCHIPLKVVNYLNKYYKVPTSSQTEISDNEIEVESKRYGVHGVLFSDGAKWYREQLKK